MDTSSGTRRLVFGLIVCALVALGAYLLGSTAHGAGRSAGRQPGPTVSPEPHSSAPDAGSAGPSGAGPAVSAAAGPDIYQWLPFTQAGLAAAAAVVVRFGNAYGTFSYTQSAAEYVAPMQAITSGQLVGQIKAAYSTAGVVAARVGGKQVSAGTATIESIRAFGPSSLTFVVQVSQRMTDSTGGSQVSTGYAVTVTGNGTSWLVSDIELASAGNS
jgi:hypothetical protein